MDVETNVGKEFLKLLDLHFPPGHILRSVMCRSAVKVSYRCLPNMGAQVAKQNAKNMKNAARDEGRPPPTCNCQRNARNQCPIPGACNQKGVMYQATVKVAKMKLMWVWHPILKESLLVTKPKGSTTHIFGRKKMMEISWKISSCILSVLN